MTIKMFKYKTDTISDGIFQVEIDRETKKSIWINGRRQAKTNSYENYHNTWTDAFDYLMTQQAKKLKEQGVVQ